MSLFHRPSRTCDTTLLQVENIESLSRQGGCEVLSIGMKLAKLLEKNGIKARGKFGITRCLCYYKYVAESQKIIVFTRYLPISAIGLCGNGYAKDVCHYHAGVSQDKCECLTAVITGGFSLSEGFEHPVSVLTYKQGGQLSVKKVIGVCLLKTSMSCRFLISKIRN